MWPPTCDRVVVDGTVALAQLLPDALLCFYLNLLSIIDDGLLVLCYLSKYHVFSLELFAATVPTCVHRPSVWILG